MLGKKPIAVALSKAHYGSPAVVLNGVGLVSMKAKRLVGFAGWFDTEYVVTPRVQRFIVYQLLNTGARLQACVQLEQWIRPEKALVQLTTYVLANAMVADVDEALDVPGIVMDKVIAQRKDVHGWLSSDPLSVRRHGRTIPEGIQRLGR